MIGEKNKSSLRQGGFTIAELMIAIGVFSIAASLIVGVFVNALRAQRLASALIGVNSNASVAIEQFTREARLGFNFSLENNGSGCGSAEYDTLRFERFRGTTTTAVVYQWNESARSFERAEGGNATTTVTAPDVLVERLCFLLGDFDDGTETRLSDAEFLPWRVQLVMSVGSRYARPAPKPIRLQTSVTSRILPHDL